MSHYFFDKRLNDPHFNFGLLLPDLVRNFSPGSKLKLVGATYEGPTERSLLDGCLQHADSDKIFHAWSGFHELMSIVTTRIRAEEAIEKDWFVAHILVELVMDHFLLKGDLLLANRLYTEFEMLDMDVIQSFLSRNDLPKFEQFESGMGHFMRIRYLEKYHETASILYALTKICTKVKLSPFTESQKRLLNQLVLDLVKQMPNRVVELHEELK